jgi:hypothetical protein
MNFILRSSKNAQPRQSAYSYLACVILYATYCELVFMVNINEVNKALALTFPSLEFIELISTYDYLYCEIKLILVMRYRDRLGRKVESKQRIIAFDSDSLYKECCKAARRFINKDTGSGGETK